MTPKRLVFVTRFPDRPVPERIKVLAAAMGLEVAVVDFNAPQLPRKPLMVWVDECHVCQRPKTCCCSLLADEPDEACPVHGMGEWPPRCETCGQFMPRKP